MAIGPVELLVVRFPGNEFKGEIVPALRELVESRTIRIIDILFAHKSAAGELTLLEINDLDAEAYGHNSSGALMLFENTWATRFADAVHNAKGEVVLNERIPRVVIEELLAAEPAS
jgi:hypothetical protein